MGIPVNPSIVAAALPYTAPLVGFAMPLCQSPTEGLKGVGMQFGFSANNNWQVDLSLGNPTPPLSQCCALFIDAIDSTQAVTIVFADSGYRVPCAAGRVLLAPVLSGVALPKFFIGLPATSGSDIINVIALNQFIPEFSAP